MIVESVDGNELQRIMEESSPSPRVVPGTTDTAASKKNSESDSIEGEGTDDGQEFGS